MNHPVGYLRIEDQEEYEAQQRELDEQMTYEKRLEEAEQSERVEEETNEFE